MTYGKPSSARLQGTPRRKIETTLFHTTRTIPGDQVAIRPMKCTTVSWRARKNVSYFCRKNLRSCDWPNSWTPIASLSRHRHATLFPHQRAFNDCTICILQSQLHGAFRPEKLRLSYIMVLRNTPHAWSILKHIQQITLQKDSAKYFANQVPAFIRRQDVYAMGCPACCFCISLIFLIF